MNVCQVDVAMKKLSLGKRKRRDEMRAARFALVSQSLRCSIRPHRRRAVSNGGSV